MLMPIIPQAILDAAPAEVELSYIGGATGSSSVVVPADVEEGDLLVFAEGGWNINSSPGGGVPTDFTLIYSNTTPYAGRVRQDISYKIAEAGDAGSTINGVMTNVLQERRCLLMAFSTGGVPLHTVTVNDAGGEQGASGSTPTYVIDAADSDGTKPVITVAHFKNITGGTHTMSPTEDESLSNSSEDTMKCAIYNVGDTLADSSISISGSADPAVCGGAYLELEGGDITIDISVDSPNVDIFALAGSPAVDVNVIVNVADGVDIYSTTSGAYACDCEGFTSGSTVKFNMVNANITGASGAGGDGGSTAGGNGSPGGDGSTAIRLGCTTTFNGTGTCGIRGGGGGGGGGGGARQYNGVEDEISTTCTATQARAGGAGGVGEDYDSAATSGAAGGSDTNAVGGTGGDGGALGTAGNNGGDGTGSNTGSGTCPGPDLGTGGAGGAAGASIETQSNSYTLNGVTTTGSIVT